MAEIELKPPPAADDNIPFYRDGRVIGVLAQIAFVIVVVAAATWIFGNLSRNLITQVGESQFICRDGSTSFRCAFDFMSGEASFDISETPVEYDPSDSYWRAIYVGFLNTVKVSFLGIILATIIGVFVGIARLSDNWLVNNVAKWYVDLMRNTPLLLQLFFLYFAVILQLPPIREAIQPLGLPIFLSQRGFNLPAPVFMPSFTVWLAFIVLGIVQAQILWVMLGRREEKTGKATNRPLWVTLSFIAVVAMGWLVTSAYAENQGILVSRAARVREFDDIGTLVTSRLPITKISDLDDALADGRITEEMLAAAAVSICAVDGSNSLANLTSQLRGANIPFAIERSNRIDSATSEYAEGGCDLLVAPRTELAAERDILESPAAHLIVPIAEAPVRISVPRLEGLNFTGGMKLTQPFAAALIGLALYTGAFIAEIVRAGIQSVGKGQSEAARALGLSESQRLRLVVLPQALRVIIPPLTSQYLNLTKNSSLAQLIAFPELWSIGYTTINQSGRAMQLILIVMGTYLTISLSISALLNWYNNRISLVER